MRLARFSLIVILALAPLVVATAQAPQRGAPPPQPPPGGQPGAPGARGGGGRGRGAIQVMTLASPAWPDGSTIPRKYSQAGDDMSPPLAWRGAPEGIASFVLVAHDVDAIAGGDDVLHWLVRNIPGNATGLPDAVPRGATLPDGSRQISATGPSYRGPGAPASGPSHHYVFELYALDSTIEVPAVGA